MEGTGTDESLFAAARQHLRLSLKKSSLLSCAIEETSLRLDRKNHKLPLSATEVCSSHAQMCKLSAITERVNRAIGPVAAALTAHEAIHKLERQLCAETCHGDPLDYYLLIIKQAEGALRFLSGTCELAVKWMEDIVQPLDNDDVRAKYELNVKRTVRILMDMKGIEARACLKGGFFSNAFDKLEVELRRMLKKETHTHSQLSEDITSQKIQAILGSFDANGRLENCATVYVDVRSSSTRAALQALHLRYLDTQVSPLDSVCCIEDHIAEWGKHLEFAVKNVLQAEHVLCRKVFHNIDPDVAVRCFARIINQCGFLELLQFGFSVTETKKDATKLLKLLEIFRVLDKLRLDFNWLFGKKNCIDAQTLTRDLIKKVVEGGCDIFIELPLQVELHRSTPPPSDSSVPQLVMSVTNLCIMLLEDEYGPTLSHIMSIHWTWNHKNYSTDDTLLGNVFCRIMRSLQINLEKWSMSYRDNAQAYFFLMNNYWCLQKKINGTTLADLMGEEWVQAIRANTLHYSEGYLRESWGKLLAILNEDGSALFSLRRAAARELVKKRLKEFNHAFESMYEKQLRWVVSDECMRETICQLVTKTIVPGYRSYLHNYAFLVDDKGSSSTNKYVKYSAFDIETLITCLFQGNVENLVTGKQPPPLIRKVSGVANRFRTLLI